jgi:predicted component of type VI protein secretion system
VPLSAARLSNEALGVLATGRALAEQLLATRWTTVFDALRYGASLDQVAAAMGLDIDKTRAGSMSWLDGQRAEGILSEAEYVWLRAGLAYATVDGDQ